MKMPRERNRQSECMEDDANPEESIKECVRFILSREGSKLPIKRSEIHKHLAQSCQTNSGQLPAIVAEANKKLKRVYGCKLVQVEAKSGVQYIVVLTEPCESLPSTVEDTAMRRLLMASLTHVFMSGGSVLEDDMWKFLEEAGLMEEEDYAARKAFISTFTKQMYFTYTKVGDAEMVRNVFEWGQRAVEEVPKMFLLKKVAEALEKPPDHWCEQYKEAMENVPQEA